MGTKVGNNPGIFLRAPALLLLFPVISPPTPGWRGFLRSLPTDVLWPGCSVPTALYTEVSSSLRSLAVSLSDGLGLKSDMVIRI